MRRFTRRAAVILTMLLAIEIGVPVGGLPPGDFPLSWLESLFATRAGWAASPAGVPVQKDGDNLGLSGYVPADATGPDGGAGRAPVKVAAGLDGYRPPAPETERQATIPTVRGFDEKTSVRDAAASKANMDEFVNADGSVTRRFYPVAVNYQAPDGTWRPISTKLSAGTDGRLHAPENALQVSVTGGSAAIKRDTVNKTTAPPATAPATPSATQAPDAAGADEDGDEDATGVVPSGPLVSVVTPGGESLATDLSGATLATPKVVGSTATYRDVLPKTDVQVTALADGVRQRLILASPAAGSEWILPLGLSGLTPRLTASGAVEFTTGAGAVAYTLKNATMADKSFRRDAGDFARSSAIAYALTTVSGKPGLKVTADAGWLGDSARRFPVTVDLTATTARSGDAFVDNDATTGAGEQSGDSLAVGTYDGGATKARSFLHFDGVAAPAGRLVSAKLNLRLTWQPTCGGTPPFSVHKAAGRAAADAEWPGPALSAAVVGSYAVEKPGTACTNTTASPDAGTELAVPLTTSAIVDADGAEAAVDLAIATSETDPNAYKRFASAADEAALAPSLEVTALAANVAPQIDTRYPAHGAQVETRVPQLVSRAHDPDKSPNTGLKYSYVVKDLSNVTVASSGWVTTAAWTVPATALKWNTTYQYTVQVNDNSSSSAVYPAYQFTTTVPQPALTSSLTQNADRGYDANTGNYTTSATDAQIAGVGPALAITRDYNSLDVRRTGAFGQGWASPLDMQAAQTTNAAGAVQTIVITYASGQQVAFGRNSDGTFAPPNGRFATLKETLSGSTVTGYTLTDKDASVYTFNRSAGAGVFRITSVTDANGRTLTYTYDATSGQLTKLTSASGRSLTIGWGATPTPSTGVAHVTSVTTDPPVTGGTGYTWTYNYTNNDRLTSACPPGTTTACTTYTWTTAVSQHANSTLDLAPNAYWRLNDAVGSTMAVGNVLANGGVDNGRYNNVTLGGSAAYAGSTATTATFNGTTSNVQLPGNFITDGSAQTISLWFKTTGTDGPLFSYQNAPLSGTPASITPALYVDENGKLRGEFYNGDDVPMTSIGTVNDGQWHHAVLTGAGNSQRLYLDSVLQDTMAGAIQVYLSSGAAYEFIGAGHIGWGWPDSMFTGQTPRPMYFEGQIADVSVLSREVSAGTVGQLYGTGANASSVISQVTRPTGRITAEVSYSTATGRVTSVKDENGGTWTLGATTVVGDSSVYVASVLGGKPQDYWRLQDPAGTLDALNEVVGGTASYQGTVTYGAAGPFSDSKAVTFSGAAGAGIALPATDIPAATAAPMSIGVWFKTAATTAGILVDFQTNPLGAGGDPGYVPVLYVGSDGKLHGSYCWCSGTGPMTGSPVVNDNKWHFAMITRSTTAQYLYLDGVQVDTKTMSTTETRTLNYGYLGAGRISSGWPGAPASTTLYYKGSLAEAAFFPSQLSAAAVQAQFAASSQTVPVADTLTGTQATKIAMPVKVVKVTDPGGQQLTYAYDLVFGRPISQTDALGNTTRFGYDTGGFTNLVYDPRGVMSQTVQDARGNTIQQITCQNQAQQKCSSVYFEYYLNASNPTDPRNDVVTATRDGRSASATDNTYKTTYTFDAKGNATGSTDPLGRTSATTYTDGTTVVAVDGGFAPPGLPATITNPAGAIQRFSYYASGDLATVTSPTGRVVTLTYDKLGRRISETEQTSTYPAGRTATYTFDNRDRVVTETSPPVTNRVTGAVHTKVTTNTYDDDGNMVSQSIADATGGDVTRTVSATFNSYGQLQTSTDAVTRTTSFEYNVYGYLVRETDADGGVTVHNIDAEGNNLETKLLGYTGDPNNPSAPVDKVLESQQYDPAGRLASQTDAAGWTTTYTYTDNGLPLTTTRTDGTNSFVVESVEYDAAGNVTSRIGDNGGTTTTYAYDAASRMYRATLDPNGLNRVTTSVFGTDDTVLSTRSTVGEGEPLAATDYTYDTEGRLLSETRYLSDPTAPVGRWKLTETSGTTAADSAGNATVTTSGVTWSTDHPTRPGLTGSAQFNDTASNAQTAGPVIDTSRSFTVAAWVNLGSTASTQKIVSATGAQMDAFDLRYDQTGKWQFQVNPLDVANGTSTGSASFANAQTGTWTHLVGVYDATTKNIKLYVNGVVQESKTVTGVFNAGTNLAIGHGTWNAWSTFRFTGKVSDVQVYPRVLTGGQVNNVYTGALPVANASVARTTYVVDNGGLVTSTTDPNGNVSDIVYDEADNPVVMTGPAVTAKTTSGTVTARPVSYVGYDTFGNRTETVDANGNRTVHVFDRADREYETRLPAYTPPGSSTPITPVKSVTYDVLGQPDTITDAAGKVTTLVYDQLGRVAKVTAPDGGITRTVYDMLGNPLSVTDPNGAVTTSTYDFMGRLKTSTDVVRQASANYTTTNDYDSAGRLRQVRSPGNVTTTYTYNAASEPLTVTDGASKITKMTYDGLGRVVKVEQPDLTYATSTYDMLGRQLSASTYSAAGTALTTESKTYDAMGNMLTATDERGTTSTFTYDPTGMPLTQVQPITTTDAITTSFGYDLAGNRTQFVDGRGNAFWTTYNVWNLPESQIEPATAAYPAAADRTYTTAYNVRGRPASVTQPGGVTQAFTYDDVGNLTSYTGSGAEAATADRTFGYDLAGRMTSFAVPGASNTITYDDRDQPLTIAGPSGNSSFAYNGDGAMTTRTDAAGTTNYSYDSAGRLAALTNTGAGVDIRYTYNDLSDVSKLTYGTTGNTRTFTYDDLHRLTSDELKTPGGTSIAKIAYGWDANGNETSKTTTNFNGTTANTYTYDLADRLTSWNNGTTTTDYAYDKAGNRTRNGTRYFTYDQRNRLTSDGAKTYTYTPRGTLSGATSGTVTTATAADAFDQVISQGHDTGTQTYSYDALNRVIRPGFAYTGLGNDLAGDGTATYVRDPEAGVVGEVAGASQRLAWTDLHDDVVGQFTATGTALAGAATYDPLGAVLAVTTMIGNLGYQSEWTDGLTGRVNMLARWYNTDTGQFDSRDTASNSPIPNSVDANRYQYGNANPLTVTDPSGHGFWGALKSVGSGIVNTAKAVGNTVARVANSNPVTSWIYNRAAQYTYSFASWGMGKVSAGLKKVGLNNLAKKVDKGRKKVAAKAKEHKKKADTAKKKVDQGVAKIKSRVDRAVKKSVKALDDARKATVKFVKEHKKAIIEITVGVVVMAGCMAVTAGAGSIGCAALAGAASSLAGQGVACAEGKEPGACSVGSFVKAGLVGGISGAVGGAVGGPLGGKLAQTFLGKGTSALTRGLFGAANGAITGGASGAASGAAAAAVDYGMSCGKNCSLKGLGGATFAGARDGGIAGMVGGAGAGFKAGAATKPKPEGCRFHSFDPTTPVVMADGSTKPIKNVSVGDKVKATDPATGKTVAKPVTQLHLNHDRDLADVTVKNTKTGKETVLHTTWHHPFWNSDAKKWTDAADLKPGTHLRDDHGKTTQIVTAIKIWTGLHWMRDLTVADIHTYYVLAGTTPVLVHNNNGACPIAGHDGSSVNFFDAPTNCTCPKNVTIRNGAIERPGGAAESDEWTTSSVSEDITEQRRQAEAAGKALKDITGAHDPAMAGAVGAALVANRFRTWGKKLADWWRK